MSRSDKADEHAPERIKPPAKAVALSYKPDERDAPVVVAKGKGHVAEAILNKAREHGVPIQEDPSLVEVLSKLEIDQAIPPELYQLVAEVLSFVYRTDKQAGERRREP
ncbi:EscU/YscU/HrcU family type III secretion system export apparatus switch protein [Paenibacillus thermoaerophilus]|uniref:EscU/YscU/HrcU family type III secretion system export apparatus switch protein n=1 Tax=Paenibacillus thermoaerophilus TaxID=1215385 RepID=A0ABW2V0P7_9BACL|nr:EscU/YscU/HrcU family type III secretion system export apparatus switch protein [Paenibacillus thermoaerophilus]TMV13777.1 EscU/YscU/HrcU family type III secretion system export apparatus switch protein [Paenibacillus thermoaerophilus]